MKYLVLAAVLLCAAPAFAATELQTRKPEAAPAVTPKKEAPRPSPYLPEAELAKHQGTINRVQHYLTGLTTVVSEFTQVAPDGSLATGKFYLKRPGKMRWEYNPPTPILIVSSGSELVFYDKELQQVSHIPLGMTLAGFLARPEIRFDNEVGIESFRNEAAMIRLTISQRDDPDQGKLTLEFSDSPLVLRSMVIRDASNQVTNVALSNARFGVPIDRELFIFRDPRKKLR